MSRILLLDIVIILITIVLKNVEAQSEYWEHYGNNEKGNRYSPLYQINKNNVKKLELAWIYEYEEPGNRAFTHEVTPVLVDDGSGRGRDVLVICTPWNDMIGINPNTGKHVWNQTKATSDHPKEYQMALRVCRGLSTWRDPAKADGSLCRQMVYMATTTGYLVAVDAATGRFCPEFGNGGKLNLTVAGSYVEVVGVKRLLYYFTSPPQVVHNTVVTGDYIFDYVKKDKIIGQPRGFDCRTGRKKWQFNVIPQDSSDPASSTWWNGTDGASGGNVWAPISGDPDTNTVYLATSSPQFNFWGGDRMGENLYTDSVVALNSETGELKWYYQFIKHDIWNYDLGAQPIVTEINYKGKMKKVVLEITKLSMLFILDAETGLPLYPVEERPVPASTMKDEYAWPTQKFVVGELGNLTVQEMTLDDIFDDPNNPEHKDKCRDLLLNKFKVPNGSGKIFTPTRTDFGTIIVPGDWGGGNWMSLAVDPDKQIAVIPLNNLLSVRQILRLNETFAANNHCFKYWNQSDIPYESCSSLFLSDQGVPCYKPPWAQLVAIDLSQGKVKWKRPYGSPASDKLKKEYGSWKVFGGAIITASGLVVTSGGEDKKVYVYDLDSGDELWESEALPHEASSVPMTYMTSGRQYVVFNVAGHFTSPDRGGTIYAFALPDRKSSRIKFG